MSRLERGRIYHCRELSSGRTGHLVVSDTEMALDLFDYDEFFHIEGGAVLHCRLETSRTASLHKTSAGSSGRRIVHGPEPVTTYHSRVHANAVVVGDQPWEVDDPISRASFCIQHTKDMLWSSKKVRQFARGSLAMSSVDTQVFDIRASDLRVRCWYAGTGSFDLGLSEWWPIFEIEFDTPRRLDTYLDDIHRILRFFSAAAGFQLTPSKIGISRLSHEEMLTRIKKGTSAHDHEVEYMWPEASVRRVDLGLHYAFACAVDKREAKALSSCLAAWLDRAEDWEEASTLMMGSLALHNEVSADRLLMACRWLEKIPGASADQALADEALTKIVDAAVQEAAQMGFSGLKSRIEGALKALKSEAHRDRFARLIATVRVRFPNVCLSEDTIPQLLRALQVRGTIAHGLYEESRNDVLDLQRSFTAVEALGYLLMIKDLPMTRKGHGRALSNRVVRDHQYAATAR